MNPTNRNTFARDPNSPSYEETLRLLARITPPPGLEERVQDRLHAAAASGSARVFSWPAMLRFGSHSMTPAWMRAAAAAAIVTVIVGGSWGVYSHLQISPTARVVINPPRVPAQGSFSNAGAMRTPQTLNGPLLAPPAAVAPPAAKQTTGAQQRNKAVSPAIHSSLLPARPAKEPLLNQSH